MIRLLFIGLLVISQVYTQVTRGLLTFYGAKPTADGGGACMLYDPRTPISDLLPTVAIGDYGKGEKCGRCVRITPLGTGTGDSKFPQRAPFIAYVNNQCPECGSNKLDLAEKDDGIWDINWEFVSCPVDTDISFQLKSGSTQYWTELQVRDYAVGLRNVEFLIGQSWVGLERQPHNYWKYGTAIPNSNLPVSVRLTSINGDVLTTSLSASDYKTIQPALITRKKFQFPTGTPANPPTPVKPPSPVTVTPTPVVIPPPTGTLTCGITDCSNNNWWVEFVPPPSIDTSKAIAQVQCGNVIYNDCSYHTTYKKYQCNPGAECKSPVPLLDGRRCPIPLPGAIVGDSSAISTSSSNNVEFSPAAITIVSIMAVIIVVLIVVIIVIVKKRRISEIV